MIFNYINKMAEAEPLIIAAEELGLLELGSFAAEEAAEIGAIESIDVAAADAPEIIASDFLTAPEATEFAELPEYKTGPASFEPMYDDAEVQQFLADEWGVEPVEEFEPIEDEMVERRVDISKDFDYQQLPEELEAEQENIFDKMKQVKGDIEAKIESLKSQYGQAYEYVNNVYQKIRNAKIVRIGGTIITINTLIKWIKHLNTAVKTGKEVKDMGDEFGKWARENNLVSDSTSETTQPPLETKTLSYEDMTSLVKTYNNKQETIEFLARHKEEYDALTPEQKQQLLTLAKQNF